MAGTLVLYPNAPDDPAALTPLRANSIDFNVVHAVGDATNLMVPWWRFEATQDGFVQIDTSLSTYVDGTTESLYSTVLFFEVISGAPITIEQVTDTIGTTSTTRRLIQVNTGDVFMFSVYAYDPNAVITTDANARVWVSDYFDVDIDYGVGPAVKDSASDATLTPFTTLHAGEYSRTLTPDGGYTRYRFVSTQAGYVMLDSTTDPTSSCFIQTPVVIAGTCTVTNVTPLQKLVLKVSADAVVAFVVSGGSGSQTIDVSGYLAPSDWSGGGTQAKVLSPWNDNQYIAADTYMGGGFVNGLDWGVIGRWRAVTRAEAVSSVQAAGYMTPAQMITFFAANKTWGTVGLSQLDGKNSDVGWSSLASVLGYNSNSGLNDATYDPKTRVSQARWQTVYQFAIDSIGSQYAPLASTPTYSYPDGYAVEWENGTSTSALTKAEMAMDVRADDSSWSVDDSPLPGSTDVDTKDSIPLATVKVAKKVGSATVSTTIPFDTDSTFTPEADYATSAAGAWEDVTSLVVGTLQSLLVRISPPDDIANPWTTPPAGPNGSADGGGLNHAVEHELDRLKRATPVLRMTWTLPRARAVPYPNLADRGPMLGDYEVPPYVPFQLTGQLRSAHRRFKTPRGSIW